MDQFADDLFPVSYTHRGMFVFLSVAPVYLQT